MWYEQPLENATECHLAPDLDLLLVGGRGEDDPLGEEGAQDLPGHRHLALDALSPLPEERAQALAIHGRRQDGGLFGDLLAFATTLQGLDLLRDRLRGAGELHEIEEPLDLGLDLGALLATDFLVAGGRRVLDLPAQVRPARSP